MPIYMIERNYAQKIEADPEAAEALNRINDEEGVRWLISFLSANRKKTFCLYEAPNAEALQAAAQRAGLPADAIVEVGEEMRPDGKIRPMQTHE